MPNPRANFLAPHVLDAIDRFVENPELQRKFRKIGPTLEAAFASLEQYPKHYRVTVRESFKPQDYAPKGRPDLLFAAQFAEISQLSGYLLLGNVYKLRALIEDIADGLDRYRFLMVVGAVRALLENLALIEHLARKDKTKFDPILALSAKDLARAAKTLLQSRHSIARTPEERDASELATRSRLQILEVQKHLRTQMQLRKSNVLDGGGPVPSEMKQTNTLTMIENRLRYVEHDITPLTSYEALCEFVHPNGSSYGLFVDHAAAGGASTREFRLSATPTDWTLHIVVLSLIAAPILECLPTAVSTLGKMRQRWTALEKVERDFRHYSKT